MAMDHPLPPGSDGLPLIGETIAFIRNPFGFIDERLAAHGRVFRSKILGRRTVVIAGPEPTTDFIDPNKVMREGSMPPHIQDLFGGRSLPLLDDDVHRARKQLVLKGFDRAALTAYVPVIQSMTEQALEQWSASGEIRLLSKLKSLAIEVICRTVIGMEPGAELDGLRRDYGILTGGFAALPVNVPGTKFAKALKARDRILEVFARCIAQRRANPTEDGLSRILAAATPDGVALTDAEAVLELHHIVIAGFIVFAELAATVVHLTQNPEVRSRLSEEIERLAPSGPMTVEGLTAMPYLLQVVMEVKRTTPIIPAIFGKAKTSFELDGFTIPAGWMIMWSILPSHMKYGVYTSPDGFDPDRFSTARMEQNRHEHAFVPQGAGPATGHRCPGLDFATYFMEVFTVALLRGYTWDLPPQNLGFVWTKTPPEPADGLRATIRRTSG